VLAVGDDVQKLLQALGRPGGGERDRAGLDVLRDLAERAGDP